QMEALSRAGRRADRKRESVVADPPDERETLLRGPFLRCLRLKSRLSLPRCLRPFFSAKLRFAFAFAAPIATRRNNRQRATMGRRILGQPRWTGHCYYQSPRKSPMATPHSGIICYVMRGYSSKAATSESEFKGQLDQ